MKATVTLTKEEINELFIAIGSEIKTTESSRKHFETLGLSELKRVAESQLERLNSVFEKLTEADNKLQAEHDRRWYGVF